MSIDLIDLGLWWIRTDIPKCQFNKIFGIDWVWLCRGGKRWLIVFILNSFFSSNCPSWLQLVHFQWVSWSQQSDCCRSFVFWFLHMHHICCFYLWCEQLGWLKVNFRYCLPLIYFSLWGKTTVFLFIGWCTSFPNFIPNLCPFVIDRDSGHLWT